MKIFVKTKPSYTIKIEKGLIKENGLPRGFIITDSNVYEIYKSLIKDDFFCIKSGEQSKDIDVYKEILEKIRDNDTIIAFGGGVVGDIAGFVASTYKRGVKLIHIPTTLLAMVDSSIGGKNGVNLGEKKNYIGTIYQPFEVIIDPLFLETLQEKEWQNGLSEVIKYSYLFGKPDIKKISLKIDSKELDKVIFDCCKSKAEVVEKDPFDSGYRHVLNFGHTIGHAIELLSGLNHGEAISIGMAKELELAVKRGITNKKDSEIIINRLKSVGLPTSIPENLDKNKIIEIMKADKKGKFIFALNKERYSVKLSEEEVRSIL
ncbi:3-dehydroquinate synthase [Candidatus Pacearchaeota archaeon]|nr:hypothetical protein [uncultured archaeon]AQS33218.1 hypothetical protein [uncultured archaeon]MBS3091562.1 3-dehydroquinate synthase [Candidatus Pacearchaeota archaeon]